MEEERRDQGCTSGIMGQDTAERPHQVRFGGGGVGGSAYPDWTAQVEKSPGSSLIRPREVPIHP